MASDSVILTDADGVLLNWFHSFSSWMQSHGYEIKNPEVYDIAEVYDITQEKKRELTKNFNESCWVAHIPPLRDAVKYVRKLHEEHGYVFHCITSLSLDPYAAEFRRQNLETLFGKTVFEKLVCLDTGADKDNALEPYRDSGLWWIEDKEENCDLGLQMGLKGILVAHGHNVSYEGKAPRLRSWKEIYNHILEG